MSDTRIKIIELATQLVMKKGFNAFSYADIAQPLNIKNAAVHYHFPSKEDLGVAVVKGQIENLHNLIGELKQKNTSEIEQLQVLFGFYEDFANRDYICLIGSMGADILTLPSRIQIELRQDLQNVLDWLVEILVAGQAKGIFKTQSDNCLKANMILNNLVAGAVLARLTHQNNLKDICQMVVLELTS
jgi:AcrR family transcriptional regulator